MKTIYNFVLFYLLVCIEVFAGAGGNTWNDGFDDPWEKSDYHNSTLQSSWTIGGVFAVIAFIGGILLP